MEKRTKMDSFIFYRSFYEAISELTDKEKAKTVTAICEYALNDVEIELNGISKVVFKLVQPILATNKERAENGKKGGRPKTSKPKVLEFKTKGYENEKPNLDNNLDNDLDYEEDYNYNLEKESEEKPLNNSEKKIQKHKHGEFKNVLLSDEELESLKERFPDSWQKWIETLSQGIEQHGYKYKNHYLAILKWSEKAVPENKEKEESFGNYGIYL